MTPLSLATKLTIAIIISLTICALGLTAPIWYLLAGVPPLQAMNRGLPWAEAAMIGLVLLAFAALTAKRFIGQDQQAERTALPDTSPSATPHARVVQIIMLLMFIVPFLTILAGYLLHSMVDFDAG